MTSSNNTPAAALESSEPRRLATLAPLAPWPIASGPVAPGPIAPGPVAPVGSRGPDEELSPRLVLGAVLYWWKVALPVGLLLAGLAMSFIWATFVPKYEAAAWLRIERPVGPGRLRR